MDWKLIKELTKTNYYQISSGGGGTISLNDLKNFRGTSVAIVYSEKLKLYQVKTKFELPYSGTATELDAVLVGIDEDHPHWYLKDLFAMRENERLPLFSWNNNLGVALLLRNLRGVQPHYLELPEKTANNFDNEYSLYSTTDSSETRKQIKSALEELANSIKIENNLSQIIYSDLLKE
jgi:hypothetical protein